MAYMLQYWREVGPDAHDEIKAVRLKSIIEATPLALAHNRPEGTDLVTVSRHRNYRGRKWIDEKTVWENGKGFFDVVMRPEKVKR